jgi:DNA-binding response OmpR family regulator
MGAILVIDDDPYLRELARVILTDEGYTVCAAADGREALDKLAAQQIDLCIVDVMMPKMDGIEFCKVARKYYEDLPLLMLTAKGQLGNKVEGFNAGADDYLVKPFEGAELVVRVKALLRRYRKLVEMTANAGALTLDRSKYIVQGNGQQFDLPRKEFELLFLLAGNAGRIMTRQQLLDEVWGFDFDGNEHTLDVHINRLRERFDAAGFGFEIVTMRGLGYRLQNCRSQV